MKRLFLIATLFALLCASLVVAPAFAEEPVLTTNKTTYNIGEPIIVTASSANTSGKDWVGLVVGDNSDWGTLRWAYLNEFSGSLDIRLAPHVASGGYFAAYQDIPAGEYTIYLMPDDLPLGGDKAYANMALASVKITVVGETTAPVSAKLTLDNPQSGMADGTLTINLPAGHNADDIYVWWGNEQGKLPGYTRLARFKVPYSYTTCFSQAMTPHTLIPQGATKLLVYTFSDAYGLSKSCVEVPLGTVGSVLGEETPIAEFQVVSDIHISNAEYISHFQSMLNDIAQNSPNSCGIFAVGDVVDQGGIPAYWQSLWSTYDAAENVPFLYIGMGNHESFGFANPTYEQRLQTFLQNLRLPSGTEKPQTAYYDVWANGFHFVFLSSTQNSAYAFIGDEQYDWLEQVLANSPDNRPVFLFMHESMINTVAGSTAEEGWWGLQDDTRLRQILQQYPNAFLFNGHSHWILDSENCMYGGGDQAAIFNTSSVAYLWHSYDVVGGEYMAGSEGYYVQVFKDKVLVRGRNFLTGEWVSSAQFVVDNRYTFVNGVDFVQLQRQVQQAQALVEDDYLPESWQQFATALAQAQSALNSGNQQTVDSALQTLLTAQNALQKKPQRNQLMQQVQQLNNQVQQLTNSLQTANADNTTLTAQISSLNAQVVQLTQQLKTANESNGSLSEQIKTLQQNVNQLSQSLSQKQQQNDALSQEISYLQTSVNNMSQQQQLSQEKTHKLLVATVVTSCVAGCSLVAVGLVILLRHRKR